MARATAIGGAQEGLRLRSPSGRRESMPDRERWSRPARGDGTVRHPPDRAKSFGRTPLLPMRLQPKVPVAASKTAGTPGCRRIMGEIWQKL
jgi:hypothetical protein